MPSRALGLPSRVLGLRFGSSLRAWEIGLGALVAAWAVVAFLPDAPWARLLTAGRPGLQGLVLVPALIGAALVLRPYERALRVAAGIAGIVLAAAVLVPEVARRPELALGAPALAASAVACARWPVAALTAVAALAGFHGTIEAHTELPPRILEDALIAGVVLSTAWRLSLRGRERPLRTRLAVVALGLYVAASALAAVGAPSFEAAFQAFRASQWYLLAALVVGIAGWDAERRRRLLHGLLTVNLAVASYAVLRWITGPTEQEETQALLALGRFNTIGGELRLVGPFPAGTDLAAWTVVAVPFCTAMTLALRDRWRIVAAVAAAMSLAVMLESGVRVAALGVVPALVAVIVLYGSAPAFGARRLVTAYVAMAVLVVGGAGAFTATVLTNPAQRERYERLLTPGNDPSFKARNVKWEAALRDLEDRPFGLGLATGGGTAVRYSRFITVGSTSVDSSYLKVAVEQGFLVLGLLLAGLIGLAVTCAVATLRGRDPTSAAITAGAAGALAAWLVIFYAGNFIEQQSSLNGYLVLALAMSVLGDPAED